MKKSLVFFFFLIWLSTSCDQPTKDKKSVVSNTGIGYNLSAPHEVYLLPQSLQEISGITEIDSSTIACIQDERELVFIYDLNSKQIARSIDFGYSGDYEGIARVDSTLYILRSDGLITEIKNFNSPEYIRTEYATDIPLKDNEGLCYDPIHNYLLITPKETPRKGSGNEGKRFIYGFSLASKQLIQEPVFTIDLSVIENFALQNDIKVSKKDHKKGKKKGSDIKFQISAIAIHPITGQMFLLSSVDKLLFVFNTKNELEFIEQLNPDMFKQPEGITFMKNGDLFISNEGIKKSATLVQFKYKALIKDNTKSL
jgi:hypothetical protein